MNAYITAIADCKGILSLHIVEANTGHCVLKVVSLKSSNGRRKSQKRYPYSPVLPFETMPTVFSHWFLWQKVSLRLARPYHGF